jgi:hypothetical protein
VEDPGDAGQPVHQVGSLPRGEEGDDSAIAAANEPRRPADDLLEEPDGVVGHQLVAERAVDIGGMAVAASLG